MRGRVFGTLTASAFVAMPIGVLLAGFLLERLGVRWMLVTVGCCYLLVTLTLLINPALRDMEQVSSVDEERLSAVIEHE